MRATLLIEDQPLQLLPALAVAIGLNEAIVLQQIHFWVRNAERRRDDRHLRDGYYWVWNDYEDWQRDNFPFWSTRTIQRSVASLEGQELLITTQPDGQNRTKWYRIDYDKLDNSNVPDCHDPNVAVEDLDGARLARSITTTWHVPIRTESLTEREALKAFTPTAGEAPPKPAIATSKIPKTKPAPKAKAPPHPDTASLVAYFVELTDTPTLKASTARIGREIKKALEAGSAAVHVREALERVVKEGNPGAFVRLLNGVERYHGNHDPASRDTPIARMVLGLADGDSKRKDDGGQTLGEIAAEYGYSAEAML